MPIEVYEIEPAKCGCPRVEIKEGVQAPKQSFGGHVEGCKLAASPPRTRAPKPEPEPVVEKQPKSSTGKKGTK